MSSNSINPLGSRPLATSPTSPSTQTSLPIFPSLEKSIKEQSIQPDRSGRIKSEEQLSDDEKQFIKTFETPNTTLQTQLSEALGPKFNEIAESLEKDGVVILDSYFKGESLADLKDFFEEQIGKKPVRPFLEQASFNGGVDATTALTESKAMSEALADPLFILLASHHLGNPAVIANWRGYRLEPRESLLYRAWSWHQDQKRSEVKVMILLSDVAEDGQAMQVIKGSHKNWWDMNSQRDTKYTLDEVLQYGNNPKDQQVTKCFGKAGTIIIFNTNVAHSGYRNQSQRRDVITMNYLANIPGMPLFPSPPLHPKVASRYDQGFMAAATRKKEGSLEELSKEMIEDMQSHNDYGVREKTSDMHQVTQDVPADEIRAIYDKIPTFSQARKHFQGTSFEELKVFLTEHVLDDFGPDLDLVIRLGDKDVKRDSGFARLRDARTDHLINQRLRNFSELTFDDIRHPPSLNLENLSKDAEELSEKMIQAKTAKEALLASDPTLKEQIQSLDESIEFCKDLSEAFKRTDSCERLRTNLIFLRALYLQHGFLTEQPQFFEKERELMKLHASVIYNEDSNLTQ